MPDADALKALPRYEALLKEGLPRTQPALSTECLFQETHGSHYWILIGTCDI